MSTVKSATFHLLRELGVTHVFGNPGSTEIAFLGDWPEELEYVLGLQESVVVAMADGYAQITGKPSFVNLHSAAGVGHAMGSIYTASKNQTPMVITAGQQARSLLQKQAFLSADEATSIPKPFVKWSVEPACAGDVPLAIAQAFHIASQAPAGPVLVSIPCDDWEKPAQPQAPLRGSSRIAPDPQVLDDIATALSNSLSPAIVFGPGIGREAAQVELTELAEKLGADTWASPLINRDGIAQDHPNFAGFLPAAAGPLSQVIAKYDAVLVLGATAFMYHIEHTEPDPEFPLLMQISDSPQLAAASTEAITLVSSLKLALPDLTERVVRKPRKDVEPALQAAPAPAVTPLMTAEYVFHTLGQITPNDAVIVEEAPSHRPALQKYMPIKSTQNYFAMASGGLGFGLSAAVGMSLADKSRRVVAIIGDGSAMYTIQGLWSAAKQKLPITYIILNNGGYGAMRAFGQLLQTSNIPGTELDGLSFVGLAQSMSCEAEQVSAAEELQAAFARSLERVGPTLIEVPVSRELTPIIVAPTEN